MSKKAIFVKETQGVSIETNHGSHLIAKPDGHLCSNCFVALWVLLINMIVIVRSRCWSAAPPLLSQDRHQPEIARSPSGNSVLLSNSRENLSCSTLCSKSNFNPCRMVNVFLLLNLSYVILISSYWLVPEFFIEHFLRNDSPWWLKNHQNRPNSHTPI